MVNKLEKEKCVICGKETDVYKDTHINFRDCYIEGAGQLCDKCYKELNDRSGF